MRRRVHSSAQGGSAHITRLAERDRQNGPVYRDRVAVKKSLSQMLLLDPEVVASRVKLLSRERTRYKM